MIAKYYLEKSIDSDEDVMLYNAQVLADASGLPLDTVIELLMSKEIRYEE